MRGSWAVIDPAERTRFVTRIAHEGPAMVDASDAPDLEKRRDRLLIANALRELSRFDDARALLDATLSSIPADAGLKGALSHGCIAYHGLVESELAKQMVDDGEAYAILCVDSARPDDRVLFANIACSSAARARDEREAEALANDPAAYATACNSPLLPGATDAGGDVEVEVERRVALCMEALSLRERNEAWARRVAAGQAAKPAAPVTLPDNPEMRLHAADSGLRKAARTGAARVIARAKAERTYPKRQRGDLSLRRRDQSWRKVCAASTCCRAAQPGALK